MERKRRVRKDSESREDIFGIGSNQSEEGQCSWSWAEAVGTWNTSKTIFQSKNCSFSRKKLKWISISVGPQHPVDPTPWTTTVMSTSFNSSLKIQARSDTDLSRISDQHNLNQTPMPKDLDYPKHIYLLRPGVRQRVMGSKSVNWLLTLAAHRVYAV